MGRRRTKNPELPNGVHRVTSKGRVYYYYQPGRSTAQAKKREKLFGNPFAAAGSPDNERFWRELNRLASTTISFPPNSIKALIEHYRADDAFKRLSSRTQKVYDIHLKRFARPETWGLLPARQLTPS